MGRRAKGRARKGEAGDKKWVVRTPASRSPGSQGVR